MSGKYPYRDDFSIPDSLLDDHEYLVDALFDGYPGINCKVVYPSKEHTCPNCLWDAKAQRSADIYKTGGPSPFPDFTPCPVCNGEGKLYKGQEDIIKLRVYWDSKSWIKTEMIVSPDISAQIIGYMTDVNKVKRGKYLILNSDLQDIVEVKCELSGDLIPWGFRKNRYFVGYVKRC